MSNTLDHILCAYEFNGTGQNLPLNGDTIANKLKDDALAWVHLDATHPETRPWLENNIDYLDHLIIDALLSPETRPRMTQYKDGLLIILRGVNLNENADAEDMISIRIYIDAHRIITTRIRKLKAIQDMRDRIADNNAPKNAGDFLVTFSTRLFQRMEPVISELDERTDNVEEAINEAPDISKRHEIVDIRKMAILLRRFIAPQKDVLSQLRTTEIDFLDNTHKRHLHENQDRLTRYVEELDAIRERAQIVKDELTTALSDALNKNMYVLSVIAAIFLPLGFLTGLLGINIGGMPGADNDQAFWIFSGMLVVIVAAQIALFKKMKWF